ncbi:hypothetical protein HETIRDRAFT_407999 [Heterobasidion irregulare TC 32-1]|uniref:Uncharacterized protein n=1 Tax=Heterobasidion irregulare (strain TC 32-1) TaxID=747525 RepID=W4KE06_HETIT|nr:uncharacterized protein HETIRDRAFT_407999 [Heterobasidion irregulare TC 32-1]ETW83550.1 hypothetical protein HETIRDRAFT_407999 [Heterobasidion irregulare TC 32-1]
MSSSRSSTYSGFGDCGRYPKLVSSSLSRIDRGGGSPKMLSSKPFSAGVYKTVSRRGCGIFVTDSVSGGCAIEIKLDRELGACHCVWDPDA